MVMFVVCLLNRLLGYVCCLFVELVAWLCLLNWLHGYVCCLSVVCLLFVMKSPFDVSLCFYYAFFNTRSPLVSI